MIYFHEYWLSSYQSSGSAYLSPGYPSNHIMACPMVDRGLLRHWSCPWVLVWDVLYKPPKKSPWQCFATPMFHSTALTIFYDRLEISALLFQWVKGEWSSGHCQFKLHRPSPCFNLQMCLWWINRSKTF